jgi:hypothetical protein
LGIPVVGFLGFVVNSERVGIESNRISMIQGWPNTKSQQDIQVLHGFTIFYRPFIWNYAKIT